MSDAEKVQEIFSDLIDLPEMQMRRDISRDELDALADNIKLNGLINPLTVRPVGNRFELVAGQRRLMACRIAGIIRIKCVVRELSDAEALSIMAAENIERADVDVVDEANFIALVMRETNSNVKEMARRLNRGEQYVEDRLAIAEMPDYMKAFLKTGELKLGAALALVQIEPDDKRRLWVGMAIESSASVRTVEHWLYQHKLGLLPDAQPAEGEVPGAPPSERAPVMFECAVDGKKYPARACVSVFVYEPNLTYLNAIRAELNSESPPSNSETHGIGAPTPVGSATELG